MEEDTKKFLREVGWASTLGFQVAFAPFIGLAIGYWLDNHFGTIPWLTLLFLMFGVIAGFKNYYRFVRKQQDQK